MTKLEWIRQVWIPQERVKHPKCECKCSGEIIVKWWYYYAGIPRFISGHNFVERTLAILEGNWRGGKNTRKHSENYVQQAWVPTEQAKHPKCQCDCGGEIVVKPGHYYSGIPRFIHGHNARVFDARIREGNSAGGRVAGRIAAETGQGTRALRGWEEKNPKEASKVAVRRGKAGGMKNVETGQVYKMLEAFREKYPNWGEYRAEKIASGEFNPKGHYKHGYYDSPIAGKQYYASSYELLRMQQLDRVGIWWTKKHRIVIPYIGVDGKVHYYTPDFLCCDFNSKGVWLEEVKGFDRPSDLLKYEAAREWCKERELGFGVLYDNDLRS